MKVIDLLNKIAKGEKFDNCKIKFKGIEPEEISEYFLFDRLYEEDLNLNDEIEIIEEEKEIKKIDFMTLNTQKEKNRVMKDTINKLIDIVKELKK